MSDTRSLGFGSGFVICLALLASTGYAAPKDKPARARKQPPPPPPEVTLPEAAGKAIQEAFPGTTLGKPRMAFQRGLGLYAVGLAGAGAVKEVEVSAEGLIATVRSTVEVKDVPEPAVKAVREAAGDATIVRYDKIDIRAEVKQTDQGPKLVKLEKPQTAFDAQLSKFNLGGRVRVGPDGAVLESLVWHPQELAPGQKRGRKNR